MSRKQKDNIIKTFIWFCGMITVAVLAWILIYITSKGIIHFDFDFIFSEYKGDKHGILSMILITVYIVLLSIVMSTPVGIFAAIYLVEYSKQGKVLKIIRFATETLAGIPSIIYGLFGFIFFVTVLKFGFSLLAGALTLSIMVLPTIIRTTEEALKAVPMTFREGSRALGATKRNPGDINCGDTQHWQNCRRNSCGVSHSRDGCKNSRKYYGFRQDSFSSPLCACKGRNIV